ncbi:MAG: recombinase RecJ, partial [Lachnospiraceae bacterium]|nr:recombinase RecJ [Lachnospiraceae bacterium]
VTDIGNGGGHLNKAGGFISRSKYKAKYGDLGIDTYIFSKSEEYYDSCDVVYAKEGIKDTSEFALYKKLPSICGYVKTLDFLERGTECKIRTYEGDVAVKASEDIYVMIGLLGEVYPIEREKFEQKYQALEEPYFKEYEYAPSVVEVAKMKKYELLPYAKQCVRKADSGIYAKRLTIPAKVFSKWNYENYMYGKVGDYICYAPDDETDVYIVKKEIFEETYVCEE